MIMKKRFTYVSLISLILLALLIAPFSAFAAEDTANGATDVQKPIYTITDTDKANGKVTIDEVEYQIADSVEKFEAMQNNKKYILANDIDFGAKTYTGVVVTSLNNDVAGNIFVLEGNHYTLKNLHFNFQADSSLFGSKDASDTTIRNLNVSADGVFGDKCGVFFGIKRGNANLENVNAVLDIAAELAEGKSQLRVGGLIGTAYNGSTEIRNCTVSGSMTSGCGKEISGTSCLGAFAGIVENCNLKISDSTNYAALVSSDGFVGGFVGRVSGSVSYKRAFRMERCVNDGAIRSTGAEHYGVGGMVGAVSQCGTQGNNGWSSMIVECINKAALNGYSAVGGIVGSTSSADLYPIKDCVNEGTVKGTADVGGILGQIRNLKSKAGANIKVFNCTNLGTVQADAGGAAVGGTVGGYFSEEGYSSEAIVTISGNVNMGAVESLKAGENVMVGGIAGCLKGNGAEDVLVENCMNRGRIAGISDERLAGICANMSVSAPSVIQNCLNGGEFVYGEQKTTNAYAIAFTDSADAAGKMLNCYYQEGVADKASFGASADTAEVVTVAELENGVAAFKLGEGFGQQLGVEKYPVVGGNAVKNNGEYYYNADHVHDLKNAQWESVDDVNHGKLCAIGGEHETEEHTYGTAVDHGDGTHKKVCSVCNHTFNEEHKADQYVSNGDGTHSGNCAQCEAVHSTACAFNMVGRCPVCGQKKAEITEKQPEQGTAPEILEVTEPGKSDPGKKGCSSAVSPALAVTVICIGVLAVLPAKKQKD